MEEIEHIKAIRVIIQNRFGLVFSELQSDSFFKNVVTVAYKYGIDPLPETVLNWLHTSIDDFQVWDDLAKQLTIGETYFFREKTAIDLLKNECIPAFLKKKTQNSVFRIWSAGCSSGEEPYTLAITLKEAKEQYGHFNFEIIATDLNPQALEKATLGRYSAWSFRETPEAIKQKYFQKKGSLFDINNEIKDLVKFSKLNLKNLVGSSALHFAHPFDMIFCRNVLMYFDPDTISQIGKAFFFNLHDGGWFITSQVELNDVYFSDYTKQHYGGNFFYQKQLNKSNGNVNPQPEKLLQKRQIQKSTTTSLKNDLSDFRKRERQHVKPTENDSSVRNNTNRLRITSATVEKTASNDIYQNKVVKTETAVNDISLQQIQHLADTGNLTEALSLCAMKLETNPENTQLHYIHALICMETNQMDLAEKALTKLLYIDQQHLAAQFMLGGLFAKQGKNKQSKKQFENLSETLEAYDDHSIINGLEGMTAGRMRDLINKMNRQ